LQASSIALAMGSGQEVVEGMIEEVAVNIMMMTTGSSVTGALSPILPALAAAKVATGAIKLE
ncbi:hypothetical protein, partial [Klebsiella aerogenes]|uniref:hypothetical protein n=1 Tax=Klebsiella aerogenes TaxID=548 RepID=UPI00195305FD